MSPDVDSRTSTSSPQNNTTSPSVLPITSRPAATAGEAVKSPPASYSQTFLPVASVRAIQPAVGRADEHPLADDHRRRIDARARGERPQLAARSSGRGRAPCLSRPPKITASSGDSGRRAKRHVCARGRMVHTTLASRQSMQKKLDPFGAEVDAIAAGRGRRRRWARRSRRVADRFALVQIDDVQLARRSRPGTRGLSTTVGEQRI